MEDKSISAKHLNTNEDLSVCIGLDHPWIARIVDPTQNGARNTVCRGDKMTIRFVLILVGAAALIDCPAIQATKEQNQENHKTYKACVLAASEKNSKWTQYRVDVNSCRAEFDVPEKY